MSTLASLKLYGSIPLEKFSRLPVLQKDLSGKHVLVSGGSAGLGAEAVRHFALQRRPPASITILCRNVKNGERVARDVTRAAAASGNGFADGSIHVESVDLCDFASVRAFAERYNARGQALDVCLMNAGVIDLAYKTTTDGHEATLQTNVLAPFLLITLLRPSLERAPHARVAITSSGLAVCAQTATDPIFADEQGDYIANGDRKETYNGPAAYNNSKLLEAILARQFARHFPATTSPSPPSTRATATRRSVSSHLSLSHSLFIYTLQSLIIPPFSPIGQTRQTASSPACCTTSPSPCATCWAARRSSARATCSSPRSPTPPTAFRGKASGSPAAELTRRTRSSARRRATASRSASTSRRSDS